MKGDSLQGSDLRRGPSQVCSTRVPPAKANVMPTPAPPSVPWSSNTASGSPSYSKGQASAWPILCLPQYELLQLQCPGLT